MKERSNDRVEFLLPVPPSHLKRLLNEHRGDRPYSEYEARLSLLLDVLGNTVRSQAAYVRIWSWTPKTVRYRWTRLWTEVARWCSSYGRQLDSPLVEQLPTEFQRYLSEQYSESGQTKGVVKGVKGAQRSAKKGSKSRNEGDVRAIHGQTLGTHTINPLSTYPIDENKNCESTVLLADKDEGFCNPSFQQVLDFFIDQGRADLAESFFNYYSTLGWRTKNGAIIRNWRPAVKNWIRNAKNKSSKRNGTQHKEPYPGSIQLAHNKRPNRDAGFNQYINLIES